MPRLTPEEYEAKRQARYERLLAAADKAEAERDAEWKQARKMASIIPMGQPIQVNHHSTRRDINYRERINRKDAKGYALHLKAQRLRERAESARSNRAIFSDDPQASEKLEAKIARLEARQEMMKKANKLVKKNDREGLADMGFSELSVERLFIPDFAGRVGFPSYAITNNGANIRRLKERLEQIEERATMETTEREVGDIRIVEDPGANRLQIFFPDKPAADIIKDLKARGFRWTPSLGCWQAYLTNGSRYQAECIMKKIQPAAPNATDFDPQLWASGD